MRYWVQGKQGYSLVIIAIVSVRGGSMDLPGWGHAVSADRKELEEVVSKSRNIQYADSVSRSEANKIFEDLKGKLR